MITYKLDAQVIVHDGFQYVAVARNDRLFRITEDGLLPIVMRGGTRQGIVTGEAALSLHYMGTDGNGRVQFVTDVRKRRCLVVVGGEAHRVEMTKGEFDESARIYKHCCTWTYPYNLPGYPHVVYVGPNHAAMIFHEGFTTLECNLKMFLADAENRQFATGDLVLVERKSGRVRIFKFDFASHYYGACVAADGLTAVIYGRRCNPPNEPVTYLVDLS